MATLQSPGVSVSIIDQSNYASTGPGTVPFILLATGQNKTSSAGGVAAYTTASTAGQVHLVTSQKELLQNYGLPSFPVDGSGNRIYGSELAEYGLMAAHSVLGLTNSAYILRADVNLTQLKGSASRPYGNPNGGSIYNDTNTTQYGIFTWNSGTQEFYHVTPTVITDANAATALVAGTSTPATSFGNVGDYAVVATDVKNPVYAKAYDNTWNNVGTSAWIAKTATVTGANVITSTTLTAATTFKINTYTITVPSPIGLATNPTLDQLVATINAQVAANPTILMGVRAANVGGKLALFATRVANSTGTLVPVNGITPPPDGAIALAIGTGTALADLGFTAGTYNGPLFVAQPHYNVPAWKTSDVGTIAGAQAVLGSGASTGSITSVFMTNPGSGYATVPAVQIGTPWAANAPVMLNQDIVDPSGLHYRVTTAGLLGPTAPVAPGTGLTVTNGSAVLTQQGTAAQAIATVVNGSITGVTVTNPGSGYISSPTITFASPAGQTSRPTDSVWLKTTPVNQGANFDIYNYNSTSDTYDAMATSVIVGDDADAIKALDPAQGGLGIPRGTIYVQANFGTSTTGQLNYRVMQRIVQGATVITGLTTNPTFVAGDSFYVSVSQIGIAAYTAPVQIIMVATTTGQTSAAMFAQQVNAANVSNLVASVTGSNQVVLTHKTGGVIKMYNGVNTPLTTAGIVYSNSPGAVNTTYVLPSDFVTNTLIGTNFAYAPAFTLYQQDTQPITAPADGTRWFAETPIEVDIMINDGSHWRGYHSSKYTTDSRGFNLQNTDVNGVIISSTTPTTKSDGHSLLSYGDLWLDTSDLENYPLISRWQNVLGTDRWVSIDVSNSTSSDGMLFADVRWDMNGTVDPALDAKPAITDLLTSDYVDLDAPDPTLYPRGILLFNTRRSSYNVKEYQSKTFTHVNYPLMPLPAISATWHTVSGKKVNNVPYFGRRAQRNVIVSAMKEVIDMNSDIREDQRFFNLLVCPGYPELTSNLIVLNNDRRNTGFILADTPMGLASDSTTVQNYITNAIGANDTSEDGLMNEDSYTAVFYPGGAITNALDGVGQVVVPMTHAILRMVVKSDQNSYPWFAPAGSTRGVIDNVSGIGYVDRLTGKFYKIGTGQSLRDLLYSNRVNPVSVFPSVGILNYGNHTRQANATALDRINVARLINYIRYQLEVLTKPLVFEPNDKITRNEAKQAIESLMNSLVARRGLYDYLVVCDETNNTPASIDRNELHIDIAIEPAKAVEFIYIPVRILNTGAIKGTNVNNNGLSNTTPSVALQ